MSYLDSKNRIMPDDMEYHYARKLRFKCGCGKVHTFVKENPNDKRKAEGKKES